MAKNSIANLYKSNIINEKKKWDNATAAGDTAAADAAAKRASQWYNWLDNNGFSSAANTLRNQNYTQAAQSAKQGKVGVRDYSKLIGATYGLSDEQVNSMLKYDEDTGAVSIAGVNVGTPLEIEGSTYMSSGDIENAWEKAMNNLGYTKSADIQYGQQMNNYFDAVENIEDTVNDYHDEYLERSDALDEAALEGNPYDYDWAKSIMGYYNWGGENAANGEMASGAASNGGNVDSFAAANAARQQLAYTNAGANAVNESWLSRLGIVQSNLQNLAGEQDNKLSHLSNANTQRLQGTQTLFDNNETKKNNEFTREQTSNLNDAEIRAIDAEIENNEKLTDSSISGYTPKELTYKLNPYLNDDGTVQSAYLSDEYNEKGGFMQAIEDINAKLENTELSEDERNLLLRERSNLAEARAIKMKQDGYAQWAYQNTNQYIIPYETAELRNAAADRENAYDISHDTNETNIKINDANIAADTYMFDKEMEHDTYMFDKEMEFEKSKASNSGTNSSGGSSGGSSKSSGGTELSSNMKSFINDLNDYMIGNGHGKVVDSSGRLITSDVGLTEGAVNKLIEAENLTDEEKKNLLKTWNVSEGTIDTVKSEGHWKAVRQNS